MSEHDNAGIFHPTVQQRMWTHSIVLSLCIYVAALALTVNRAGEIGPWPLIGALSITAALLIGASFSLSGFCYYFDFLDTKIGYRKYLGLMGYWYAVMFSVAVAFMNPDKYIYGIFDTIFEPDVYLGVLAMLMFTFMAIISNTSAMKVLGPRRWRLSLRIGYLAWFLLVIRAYLSEGDLWFEWFQSPIEFPPIRLILSGFVIFVLLFRLSIPVAKKIKKHTKSISPRSVNSGSGQ